MDFGDFLLRRFRSLLPNPVIILEWGQNLLVGVVFQGFSSVGGIVPILLYALLLSTFPFTSNTRRFCLGFFPVPFPQ
jgi:mannose/fructose/N-acetylgalactosamine-specific phosphotransferase system component IIC